ncbi:paired amphipathic helix protein Sin3-like 3 [Asparagus officinalis]|uniref:paired amphipathic helix protein Sin3-like 3 n=1 Tax=Asparagus officinalis TaxID=4686 RepID=UPI00098E6A59|nr:paired amphipathic helix protein Sin3-like 3 [Asparagus officinalis]
MAFKGTLQFLVDMGDRFERERARYNEFFQIFMDFKDVDKRVDGDEIIRRTEELFDGEEIMVMGFYNLMLNTKRKSRKPDDLGEVFNRVLLEMMHQNQNCNHERNITQENQDCQSEINEYSMADQYKSKVRSEKKRKRNNSKDSVSTPMDDTSRKCGSSSNKETPSYKLLREPTSLHSSNSPELNELNNSCYLAVKCNRNTIRKINEYEQTLFDCEDDMFELDMLVERVKATTRKLGEDIEKNPDGQNFIKLIKLESTTNFNSANLRCLLNFYNCGVAKIMDSIREDPATELRRIYEDMKHWAEVLLEQLFVGNLM